MPPSVTNRRDHSISTIAASHSCMWLMAVGGRGNISFIGANYASSCVLLELSEWHNEITNTQAETCDKQFYKHQYLITDPLV